MRLLLLTPQIPFPPHQGTTIRNFNIIRHLAPRHEITLLTFGTPAELEQAEPLRSLCKRIEIVPYPVRSMASRAFTTVAAPLPDMALRLRSPEMHSRLAQLLVTPFDVIQVEGIEMGRYLLQCHASQPNRCIVFDDHNAEYVLQRTAFQADVRRPTRWHAALYSFIQWIKLARYERQVCRASRWTIVASGTDANAVRELGVGDNVAVVPNGVDTSQFIPVEETNSAPLQDRLVFTGKMDYRPNVDAMLWFCSDILPRIRRENASAQLCIVGQKPAPRVLALSDQPGVTVTGWVADVRPHVAEASIYVVPLRMGSGTRLKVLEAMAMGKAIVSTHRGVEGIDLVPDRDAVLADTADEFARCVVTLLRDPERRRSLGRAARRLVETSYDWHQIVPLIEKTWHSARVPL